MFKFNVLTQQKIQNKEIDVDSEVMKVLLLRNGYVPSDQALNLVGIDEYTGQNYTRMTVGNKTFSVVDGVLILSAGAVEFAGMISEEYITGAYFYFERTDDSDSLPYLFTNDRFPQQMNGLKLELDLSTLMKLVPSKKNERIAVYNDMTKTDAEKINELKMLDGVA